MSNIYILSNHGQITKQNEHLLFKDSNGAVTRILPVHTNMIALYGKISLTADAISLLAKKQIPISMKNHAGSSNVSFSYGNQKNVQLRRMQYRIIEDNEKSLEIAKTIVAGKIKNQIAFMQRIKRSLEQDLQGKVLHESKIQETETQKKIESVETAIAKTKISQKIAKNCKSLDSLRGVEGNASRMYFSVFKNNIFPEWAEFESRSKRPPLTNVNALLSFLYMLLSDELTFIIDSFGLDSMVGTLHELSYSRPSLSCDLMEEFRTPIADSLCCRLINNRIICEDDFEKRKGGVYMTREGIKKTINAFEQKMQEKYREILFHQVELYKSMVMGKKSYSPYVFK